MSNIVGYGGSEKSRVALSEKRGTDECEVEGE